jgi:Peptidase family M28
LTDQPGKPIIQTWLGHIRALSVDIGPRGSTTKGERQGAIYCLSAFQRIGLKPVLETFFSARSIFHPLLMSSLVMLAAFILYPFAGQVMAGVAALLTILLLASELLELSFRDNLLRRIVPKGQSQNVFAVIPPSGEHCQDLVLIGHIDSQRTPFIFRSPGMVKVYQNFMTVAFILFTAQALLFTLGTFFRWGWVWYATIPTAICALLLAVICIEADYSPFTRGANDNASAVGLVLTLAEQFAGAPLQHTRVYCVCTGCEEVNHYGAADFFKRHRDEMVDPHGLVFELVGCAGPGWLTQEGIVIPFHSDPGLVRLVEELSAQYPLWGAYPVQIKGGNSELVDCIRAHVPAITLFGLKRDGEAPYWHQRADTFDKMDPVVMENTHTLTWAMIQRIDRGQ